MPCSKVPDRRSATVMQRYPHQLSGGMQQRSASPWRWPAIPTLLILDEPTTGLDVTVEAEVLDLIQQLRREFSTSILFISHNLAVVAKMCDRVGVLYGGRLVEEGAAAALFAKPRHPYTVGLLRCLPQRGRSKDVAPLATIPGFPPPRHESSGCVFAARCGLADHTCRSLDPAFLRHAATAPPNATIPTGFPNFPMPIEAVVRTDLIAAPDPRGSRCIQDLWPTAAAPSRR